LLYNVYQPKLPNDRLLLKFWQQAMLDTKNVEIMLNTEIQSIESSNKVTIIKTKDGKSIESKNYIFAIPPKPMINILTSSTNKNMFGEINELTTWANNSSYFVYIPITFHWNTKAPIRRVWGGEINTDYGLVYIVLSDYMDFQNDNSKTVISLTVRLADKKSSYNNKTANECDKQELLDEVYRQLKIDQPGLPVPTKSILSPEMFKRDGKWDTTDTAFMYTKAGYRSNKSIYPNLFWVGTQNGNSNYNFTSAESAIENAIALLHDLEPKSKSQILIHSPITVNSLIIIIFVLIMILIVWFVF